jgi:hypothetical protein
LEGRHKPAVRNAPGGIKKKAAGKNSVDASSNLPHIAELICDGQITIGVVHPVGCVAAASDGHNAMAMLRRRKGESLLQLLTRLDQAIAKAYDEDVFTDEING